MTPPSSRDNFSLRIFSLEVWEKRYEPAIAGEEQESFPGIPSPVTYSALCNPKHEWIVTRPDVSKRTIK